MQLHKFFAWTDVAGAEKKIFAAEALAKSYIAGNFMHLDRKSMELALTSMLDEHNVEVRATLARLFANSADAPRHVVLSLAGDVSDVSAPILEHSPLLSDDELVDCVALGDVAAQAAVARRLSVSRSVAAALAEVAEPEAIKALLANSRADIPAFSLKRIHERFDESADMREALLGCPSLPPDLRLEIADRIASALVDFVVSRGWLSEGRAARAAEDSLERVTVSIAAGAQDEARAVAALLRSSAQLTPALLLRSLLSGDRTLFEAALVELSGLRRSRVRGLAREWAGEGFASLFLRSGLSAELLPVFRAALCAQDDCAHQGDITSGLLRRSLVDRTLSKCEAMDNPLMAEVLSLLRKLACEAAKDEARRQQAPASVPYALDIREALTFDAPNRPSTGLAA